MLAVDDLELRNFTVWGVLGLVVSVGLGALAAGVLVAQLPQVPYNPDIGMAGIAGLFAFVAGMMVYESAAPMLDGYCSRCGVPIETNSTTDSHDSHVTVTVAKPPRRVEVLGQSLVLSRRLTGLEYCSLGCADEHDAHETLTDAEAEQWTDQAQPDAVEVSD